MKIRSLRNFLFGLCAGVAVTASHASTETVQFQSLLDSSGVQPSSPFAELSIVSADALSFDFVFRAYDLNTLFQRGAYVSRIAVDTTPDLVSLAGVTTTNVSGGVDRVTIGNGDAGAPGEPIWDFRFDLGTGSNRLTASESVSWRTTFASSVDAMKFASQVKGLGGSGSGNAWYAEVAAPVPEPGTWALIVSGLLLIGLMLRRRNFASNLPLAA